MQTASNKSKMAGFTLRGGREEEQWDKGSEIETRNGQQLPFVAHLLITWPWTLKANPFQTGIFQDAFKTDVSWRWHTHQLKYATFHWSFRIDRFSLSKSAESTGFVSLSCCYYGYNLFTPVTRVVFTAPCKWLSNTLLYRGYTVGCFHTYTHAHDWMNWSKPSEERRRCF